MDIMPVQEACEALKIESNALCDLLDSGKLKAYRVGSRVWKIPKLSVQEFVLSRADLRL